MYTLRWVIHMNRKIISVEIFLCRKIAEDGILAAR